MTKVRVLSMSLAIVFLASCSEPAEKITTPEVKEAPESSNPLDGYVKAIDKAKDAEKKILEAAEKQRKALEAIEGNNTSDDGS